MTKATLGKGVIYSIHDGADPGAFVDIDELVDIPTPPVPTAEEVDATSHQSPDDFREYIRGLKDAGTVTLQIMWVPGDTEDQFLQALRESGAVRTHKVAWPGPNSWEWTMSGWIKTITPAAPIGDKMTANVEIRVTGKITMAAAA